MTLSNLCVTVKNPQQDADFYQKVANGLLNAQADNER